MDSTTVKLIEAIDVYETGLNDEYGESADHADIDALQALRKSAQELIDTIDLITPKRG